MSESDTASSDASSATSSVGSDVAEDLQQLWNEAIEQCEQVERLYSVILRDTSHLQQLLSQEETNCIMVTYQGVHQDLMDVLDSIHAIIQEDSNANLSSMLLEMLDSCECGPVNIQNGH